MTTAPLRELVYESVEAWLGPGLVLAFIAYPAPESDDQRMDAALRMSALRTNETVSLQRWMRVEGFEALLPIDIEFLSGGRNQLLERLQKRLTVGTIAMRWVRYAQGEIGAGRTPPRWIPSKAFKREAEALGISELKNFRERYWNSSLEVLPYCTALAIKWEEILNEGIDSERPLWQILSPSLIPDLLESAAQLRLALPALGIPPPPQGFARLQINWAETAQF